MARFDAETAARTLEAYLADRSDRRFQAAILAHLPLAAMTAKRFTGRGLDYDDLYQTAALALAKALERFDAGKGASFVTYAAHTMAGTVKNYFRDKLLLVRPPRKSRELFERADREAQILAQELMRSPTVSELACALQVSEEELLDALEYGTVRIESLDAPVGEDEEDGATLLELLGQEDKGFENAETEAALREAVAALPEQDREVIQLRYFENLSQREAAQRTGVSQMSISRTERRALKALRAALGTGDEAG